MSIYSGFATRQQETTYNKFVFKALQLFSEECLQRKKMGILPDSLSNLDDSNFEKKVVKIYKAMRIMEQAKHLEPKFSESIKELAKYLSEQRKSLAGDTVSRISSLGLGDIWHRSKFGRGDSLNTRDHSNERHGGENKRETDTDSNYTGFNAFGSVFATKDQNLQQPTSGGMKFNRNSQMFSEANFQHHDAKSKENLTQDNFLQVNKNDYRQSKTRDGNMSNGRKFGQSQKNDVLLKNELLSELHTEERATLSRELYLPKDLGQVSPSPRKAQMQPEEKSDIEITDLSRPNQQNSAISGHGKIEVPYQVLPPVLQETDEDQLEGESPGKADKILSKASIPQVQTFSPKQQNYALAQSSIEGGRLKNDSKANKTQSDYKASKWVNRNSQELTHGHDQRSEILLSSITAAQLRQSPSLADNAYTNGMRTRAGKGGGRKMAEIRGTSTVRGERKAGLPPTSSGAQASKSLKNSKMVNPNRQHGGSRQAQNSSFLNDSVPGPQEAEPNNNLDLSAETYGPISSRGGQANKTTNRKALMGKKQIGGAQSTIAMGGLNSLTSKHMKPDGVVPNPLSYQYGDSQADGNENKRYNTLQRNKNISQSIKQHAKPQTKSLRRSYQSTNQGNMLYPADIHQYNISSSKEISDMRSLGQLRDNSVLRRNQAVDTAESGDRYKIKSGTADTLERPGTKKMSKTSGNLARSQNQARQLKKQVMASNGIPSGLPSTHQNSLMQEPRASNQENVSTFADQYSKFKKQLYTQPTNPKQNQNVSSNQSFYMEGGQQSSNRSKNNYSKVTIRSAKSSKQINKAKLIKLSQQYDNYTENLADTVEQRATTEMTLDAKTMLDQNKESIFTRPKSQQISKRQNKMKRQKSEPIEQPQVKETPIQTISYKSDRKILPNIRTVTRQAETLDYRETPPRFIQMCENNLISPFVDARDDSIKRE